MQLVFLDDDCIAVAPRQRGRTQPAPVVREKGASLATLRARQPTFSSMSFSSVQPNETKWPAAVEGESRAAALGSAAALKLLFEVLAAVYTLL